MNWRLLCRSPPRARRARGPAAATAFQPESGPPLARVSLLRVDGAVRAVFGPARHDRWPKNRPEAHGAQPGNLIGWRHGPSRERTWTCWIMMARQGIWSLTGHDRPSESTWMDRPSSLDRPSVLPCVDQQPPWPLSQSPAADPPAASSSGESRVRVMGHFCTHGAKGAGPRSHGGPPTPARGSHPRSHRLSHLPSRSGSSFPVQVDEAWFGIIGTRGRRRTRAHRRTRVLRRTRSQGGASAN
jgi:hypothetical protein